MVAPSHIFSMPPQRITCKGLLLDMDGTIIDSTAAVIKHWESVGRELGVDPDVILQTSHGRRSIDVLQAIAPEKANWDYVRNMEALLPVRYGHSANALPGARPLLAAITQSHIPWAIVTSGTTPLVSGWLRVLELPTPEHLVVAEDVEHGKPDPSCYLLGRKKIGLAAQEQTEEAIEVAEPDTSVLVFEDSPAGIRAGKTAGCRVLAVVTTHTAAQVWAAGADWVVRDLRSVRIVGYKEGIAEVEIVDALDIETWNAGGDAAVDGWEVGSD